MFWLPSVIQKFRFPPISHSYCSKSNCLLSLFTLWGLISTEGSFHFCKPAYRRVQLFCCYCLLSVLGNYLGEVKWLPTWREPFGWQSSLNLDKVLCCFSGLLRIGWVTLCVRFILYIIRHQGGILIGILSFINVRKCSFDRSNVLNVTSFWSNLTLRNKFWTFSVNMNSVKFF